MKQTLIIILSSLLLLCSCESKTEKADRLYNEAVAKSKTCSYDQVMSLLEEAGNLGHTTATAIHSVLKNIKDEPIDYSYNGRTKTLRKQGGGAMVFDLGFHSASCYPGIPSTLKSELSGGISLSVILSQNFEIHTVLVNNKNLSADLFGKNLQRGVVLNDDRTKVVGSAGEYGSAALGHYFFYLPGFLNIATQKTSVWSPLYLAAGFAPKLPKTAEVEIEKIQSLLICAKYHKVVSK